MFDYTKSLQFDGAVEVIQDLKRLGEGLHSCGWFGGWIEVEKEDDVWEVMWCSGKSMHQPLCGPAISVEYFGWYIKNVYKSAISMWIVDEKSDRLYWAGWLAKKISKAARRKK